MRANKSERSLLMEECESRVRGVIAVAACSCIAALSRTLCLTLAVVFVTQTSGCTLPRRQVKWNCAESFTEYWTCLDYFNLAELRHCRNQQKAFDSCVLDKLGWERPDLGNLSKVSPAADPETLHTHTNELMAAKPKIRCVSAIFM